MPIQTFHEDFLGFKIVACDVEPGKTYVIRFNTDCKMWEFVDRDITTGEQTLSFDCVTGELSISGTSGNTVNITTYLSDAGIIADITNPLNRVGGTYIGPIDPSTCLGQRYYDPATGTHYQFDGTLRYQFDSVPLNLMIDVVYGGAYSDPLSPLPRLTDLIAGGLLIPGTKYRITDYATIHVIPDKGQTSTDINSGAIEPLITTALSVDTVSERVYSEQRPQDTIIRNKHKNEIIDPINSLGADWDTGTPSGDFAINVTGTDTFTIDANPINRHNNFSIYCEDDAGNSAYYDIYEGVEGVDYIITEVTPGTLREIQIITGYQGSPIPDLLDPVYAYVDVVLPISFGPRPGWIVRRRNENTNVEFPYDFTAVKAYRSFVDTADVNIAYDPAFNYAIVTHSGLGLSTVIERVVTYNNSLYVARLGDTVQVNQGIVPTNGTYWMRLMQNLDIIPILPTKDADFLNIGGLAWIPSNGVSVLMSPLSLDESGDFYEGTSKDVVIHGIDPDTSLEVDGFVHMNRGSSQGMRDVDLKYATYTTIIKTAVNVYSSGKFQENIITGESTIGDTKFLGYSTTGNIIRHMENLTTHGQFQYNIVGAIWDSELQSYSQYMGFINVSSLHVMSDYVNDSHIAFCDGLTFMPTTGQSGGIYLGRNDNIIDNVFTGAMNSFTYVGRGMVRNNIGSGQRVMIYQNTTNGYFRDNIIGENFGFADISTLSFENNTIGRRCYSGIGSRTNRLVITQPFTSNTIGDYFGYRVRNTISGVFQNNIVGHLFCGNTITQFSNNHIDNDCSTNNFGTDFSNNIVKNRFTTNTFLGTAYYNIFTGSFTNNTNIATNFIYNEFTGPVDLVNFTGATHVVGAYNTKTITCEGGASMLTYLDSFFNTNVVAVNA